MPIKSTLILNHLLPRESVELGRLVLNPKYPGEESYQPQIALVPPAAPPTTTSPLLHTGPGIIVQELQDFKEVLRHATGTNLETTLLNILSLTTTLTDNSSSTTITAPFVRTYRLQNAETYFRTAGRDASVRTWFQDIVRRTGLGSLRGSRTVYLVCGFKTLLHATMEQSQKDKHEFGADVKIPIEAVAAAAGVPLPVIPGSGLEVGVGGSVKTDKGREASFKIPGEQVYAVQYRKIRFAWFTGQDVTQANLDEGSRWTLLVNLKGDDEGMETVGLEVGLGESAGLDDLEGSYEVFKDGEEEILYHVDKTNSI